MIKRIAVVAKSSIVLVCALSLTRGPCMEGAVLTSRLAKMQGGSQQGAAPQNSSQGSSQQGATPQSSSQGSSQQVTMGAETMTKGEAKGEHKVKGCIRSEDGKYSLEDAKGHTYTLNTSEDLSAHVGHEVVIHGAVSGGGTSEMSKTETSAGAAGGNKEIAVTKVEMVSETCKFRRVPSQQGAAPQRAKRKANIR